MPLSKASSLDPPMHPLGGPKRPLRTHVDEGSPALPPRLGWHIKAVRRRTRGHLTHHTHPPAARALPIRLRSQQAATGPAGCFKTRTHIRCLQQATLGRLVQERLRCEISSQWSPPWVRKRVQQTTGSARLADDAADAACRARASAAVAIASRRTRWLLLAERGFAACSRRGIQICTSGRKHGDMAETAAAAAAADPGGPRGTVPE